MFYDNGTWKYCDTKEIMDDSRTCPRCGRMPTPEGYDACLGHIEGATAACCGHGIWEPKVVYASSEEG